MAEEGFKRINFFKGFVTTTKDWNEAELYHVEKRKLHNRSFHGVGIVPGYKQEFRVNARGRGDLSIEISPGYALDGQGNDIILWETAIKTINKADYKLPATIYVVAKYQEEFTDFVAYKENLDFKGHRRILEKAKIDFSITEPDIRTEVELARILLSADAKQILDAKDPKNPGENEIDLRYRPWAGVTGGHLDAEILLKISQLFKIQRQFFANLAKDKKVVSANSVSLAIMTMEMLLESGQLGPQNIIKLLMMLGNLEWEVIKEIEATKPSLKAKQDFGQFKHSVEVFRGLLEENPSVMSESGEPDFSTLDRIIDFQEKGSTSLKNIVGETIVYNTESMMVGRDDEKSGMSWDDVKLISYDLPESLEIFGTKWTLIDTLDILNRKSEDAHHFKIHDARDHWKTRQRLRYPDGTLVEDAGVAQEGGYAEYTILNVTPNRPLAIIRRMDYVRADYEIEYWVNGTRVGTDTCTGNDRKFRWRNWPYVIPEKYITGSTLRIKQVALTADRDVNMFKFWFYQAL